MQVNTLGNLNGIDISQFQGTPDFAEVNRFARFMIHRISSQSTGTFNPDDLFMVNIPNARAQGIPVGGYHFAGISTGTFEEAELQADNFIAQLELAGFTGNGAGIYGDLMPVLDFEGASKINPALTTDQLLEWVEHFIEYFQEKTGRQMMIYTAQYFAAMENDFFHSTRGHILAKYPLWVAHYFSFNPNDDRPPDFGGWTRWRIWQYSETGTVSGIAGPVDLNFGPFTVSEIAPPRDVINFQALPDALSMTLTWDLPEDEVDIVGWEIYQDGKLIAFVPNEGPESQTYLVEDLHNGQEYRFGIRALDTDGDYSFNIVEIHAVPEEQLTRLIWESPNGEIIQFGGQRGNCRNDYGYILKDMNGHSSTHVVEQTQKAPFQVGVSLFNADVTPRIITLNGFIKGRNRTDLYRLRQDMIKSFSFEPDRDFGPLELFNAGSLRFFLPTPYGEKELRIRAIPRESPQITATEGTNDTADYDIEFFCPNPFWIDSESFTATLPNADDGAFEFPFEPPFEFPVLSNIVTVHNSGLVSAPVIITIHGEMLNPTIRNLTALKSITLLTHIAFDEQIKIYTEFGQKRIIRILADGTEVNAIETLAISDSDFWSLVSGDNVIELVSDSQLAGSFVSIQFNPRYAGV